MSRLLPLLLALLGAFGSVVPARAHPHQFIDAALTMLFDDQGQLAAVSVLWVYDDMTSLIILEELGMDADGDGVLTEAEIAKLKSVVGTWPEGFKGDLVLTRDGHAVDLSGPLDPDALLQDGRLVTRHLRALIQRTDPASGVVEAQIFDPFYYTFYDLMKVPEVTGRSDCMVRLTKADIAAAQRLYDRAVAEMSDEELEAGGFPEIGGAFADVMRLECSGRP